MLDLVDQMQWEDLTDRIEFITLEGAGLEESANNSAFDCVPLHTFLEWFYDGQDARHETN
jgi:hypothetical protein